MELDSARELKNDLKTTVLPSLAARLASARRARQRHGRMRAVARKPAVAAIGIARHGERDYRLAVRLLAPALEHAPEIETIRRRTQGEVDIRYVGPVAKFVAPWYRRRARPLAIGSSIGSTQGARNGRGLTYGNTIGEVCDALEVDLLD